MIQRVSVGEKSAVWLTDNEVALLAVIEKNKFVLASQLNGYHMSLIQKMCDKSVLVVFKKGERTAYAKRKDVTFISD